MLLKFYILCFLYQCTYGPPCKTEEKDNFATVLRYKRTKGKIGSVLQCYLNPSTRDEVIVDTSAHESMIFHALFWPGCAFAIALCMILKVCHLTRTQRKPEALTNGVSDPEEWSDNHDKPRP